MTVFLIKAAQLILSLSILVVLHELGHFIPAKLFKTRVEKFYLFFDVKFSLFKKKIGETVYGIGWLPLGGYVKIAGMIDESMDKEQLKKPPQPWEFRSKPTWQRLIIMLGGVTVNLILGFLIYIAIVFVWGDYKVSTNDVKYGFGVVKTLEQYGFQQGDNIVSVNGKELVDVMDLNKHFLVRSVETVTVRHENGQVETLQLPEDIGETLFVNGEFHALTPRRPFLIDSIIPNSPAEKFGLQKGDKIVAINQRPTPFYSDFKYVLKELRDQFDVTHNKGSNGDQQVKSTPTVMLSIDRNGTQQELTLQLDKEGSVGIGVKSEDDDIIIRHHVKYSFLESIKKGVSYGYWTLHDYVAQLKYIFTKKGVSELGGFGAIGGLFPPTWDWLGFWQATALISIILAFMNILPIPALDGGHVVFLLYEMITGRKPNEKVLEYSQIIGFVLLILLVLYANGNDLFKAFSN